MGVPLHGNDTERIAELERDVRELLERHKQLEGQLARAMQVPAVRLVKTKEKTTYPTEYGKSVGFFFQDGTFDRDENNAATFTDRSSDVIEYGFPVNGALPTEDTQYVAFRVNDRWWLLNTAGYSIIRGLATADVDGDTDTSFTIDNVTRMQGTSPVDGPTDTITVKNDMTHDIDNNAPVIAIYDEAEDEWVGVQAPCP